MNRLAREVRRTIRTTKRQSWLLAAMLLFGFYLSTPHKAAAAACAAPSTNYGTATTTASINSSGTYRIWSRIMAPDTSSNSYLLEVDGSTCYVVGDGALGPNAWTWVDYQNGSSNSKIEINLTAGSHTLKLIGREAGVKLDRLLLVSDLACVPTGTGGNCTSAGDTAPPTVSIAAPTNNATVSGTVGITANATDNTGVSKVEFYINGALRATDTSASYSYSWDSKTVANGSYSLMAKAYDAAGNTNSDTVQVTVKNSDTQAPAPPSSLSATAATATKVNLNWKASTDNVGVAGYWINRNGVNLTKVDAVTSYSDTTVLPNTSYTYQLTAYDAAGNLSQPSATATIKTPSAPDTQAPTAPTGLKASTVNAAQINLTWVASTDNIGVAGYDVY
ncbi:MAG: Ig-like domain-containing protein, partial [Patescibacteria group bacterium]